jgi:signal transduction histidine kinase
VKRILSNLINNSVEASAGKNIIQVSTIVSHNHTQLSISDHGSGIPPEILNALNAEGQSLPLSTKEKGHGIGMTAAKDDIRLAGGTMTIRSKVGQGTIVEIRLPSRRVAV